MAISKLFLVVLIFLLFSCSNDEDSTPSLLIRRNCGEVIRVWGQNTSSSEGNPCGNNGDASRRFGIIVKNSISGNEKAFCESVTTFTWYPVGGNYCTPNDPSGW